VSGDDREVQKQDLPRVYEAATPKWNADAEAGPANLEGSETILVAGDEDAVRDIAVKALRQRGYLVLAAASGEEALEITIQHGGPIHLLITDVVMPGMSGRELSDTLLLDRPLVRTLFVSGYAEDTIVQHGVLEPGTWFIAKPFTPLLLSRKVREILDR
jgi:two-component system cell cycle sensor histidine kinase/response regulator CckA